VINHGLAGCKLVLGAGFLSVGFFLIKSFFGAGKLLNARLFFEFALLE
jgi:hypothetical protein